MWWQTIADQIRSGNVKKKKEFFQTDASPWDQRRKQELDHINQLVTNPFQAFIADHSTLKLRG